LGTVVASLSALFFLGPGDLDTFRCFGVLADDLGVADTRCLGVGTSLGLDFGGAGAGDGERGFFGVLSRLLLRVATGVFDRPAIVVEREGMVRIERFEVIAVPAGTAALSALF
jgi:hypothetical protein